MSEWLAQSQQQQFLSSATNHPICSCMKSPLLRGSECDILVSRIQSWISSSSPFSSFRNCCAVAASLMQFLSTAKVQHTFDDPACRCLVYLKIMGYNLRLLHSLYGVSSLFISFLYEKWVALKCSQQWDAYIRHMMICYLVPAEGKVKSEFRW